MTHETELNLFSPILNISKDNRRGDVYKRAITSMIIIWNLKFKGIAQNIVHKKKLKKILLPSIPVEKFFGEIRRVV